MTKWFEIFKTGTHTDSSGNTRTWTKDDIDTIVKNYDPSNHEAPIVIGHPKTNAPAYGWVEELKREGDRLLAKPKSVIAEFAEMIKKGMFKKRSASFFPNLSLNHIGFLGAKAPAVSGLKDLEFAEDKDEIVFEFETVEPEPNPKVKKELAPDPSGDGSAATQKTTVEYEQEISTLKDEINTLTFENKSFAGVDQKKKEIQEKLDKLRLRMRKAEFETYLGEKIVYGSVSPAMEKKINKLLEVLDSVQFASSEEAVEFEFTDGEKEKPIDILKSFIDDLPKQIEFEEAARKTNQAQKVNMEDGKELGKAAREFVESEKKAGREISFSYAVTQLTKDKK